MEEEKQQPILIQYIQERVLKKNKNFIMLFVGPTGSGKSYSALRLAEMLDDTFDIDRVNFKAKDFMDCINGLVERSDAGEVIKGKVIMWDEFGVEHNAREFMTIANRVINYFFQTSRHLNLTVIMTVPFLSFIDSATRKLMHGVGEMCGINTREKRATVKLKMLQTNALSGKEYSKYLRYRKNNKTYVSKKLKFKIPSKKLCEEYEIKRKVFTSQLNQEIKEKLLKSDEKKDRASKPLTASQERCAQLLMKHGVEETAEILGISLSAVYGHKTNIEKKNHQFKPIWKDKRVIHYEIEGIEPNGV